MKNKIFLFIKKYIFLFILIAVVLVKPISQFFLNEITNNENNSIWLILLLYINKIPDSILSSAITIISGFLLFNWGTKKLTRKIDRLKEWRDFTNKYITLKAKIDINRHQLTLECKSIEQKTILNCSELIITYINLLFEELLCCKNKYIKKKFMSWVEDFEIEISHWESQLRIIYPEFSLKELNLQLTDKNNVSYNLVNFKEYYTFLTANNNIKSSLEAHNKLISCVANKFKAIHQKQTLSNNSAFEDRIALLEKKIDILNKNLMVSESSSHEKFHPIISNPIKTKKTS